MEYVQMTIAGLEQEEKAIQRDAAEAAKAFVRVGWRLTRIDKAQAYKLKGYKSIAEYAKAVFNYRPDFTSNLINVYKNFAVSDEAPELNEDYKEFEFSKLVDLMKVPEEDRGMFRPEAKRDAIRDYQKFTKENGNNPENLLNWKKEPKDLLGKTILEFFRNNKEILNGLFGSEAYASGNVKDMAEIVNPSGNRHYRHKTVFLMMYDYEKGLMVSEFGKPLENMGWERFFGITQEIFGEAAAGTRTWENYFETEKTAGQAPAQEEGREIAPAQKEPGPQMEEGEQIPGQDSIVNHPEYMPEEAGHLEGHMNQPESVQPEFDPEPESITSLCYSCRHYPECGAGSGTVRECNEYINKAEAEKTEEQKYDEEQGKIDRETRRKLREKDQEEKMQHLPSEAGRQTHQIRLAGNYFDDVAAGIKSFELRKNDRRYKQGDILEMMEFTGGRNTGRLIRAEVTYLLEDYTGLEEGYCIMAVKVLEVCR